jgi:hypothetical protein
MSKFEEVKVKLNTRKALNLSKKVFDFLYSTDSNIYEMYFALKLIMFFFEQSVKFSPKMEERFLKIARLAYREFSIRRLRKK